MANDKNKRTDPDYKPQRGQEGNQNWDDNNNDKSNKDTEADKSNTSNTEPQETDRKQKTNDEERIDKGNVTGPGLG